MNDIAFPLLTYLIHIMRLTKKRQGVGRMATTLNLRDVPEDSHSRAKVQAAKEGVRVKAVIIRLLQEYLERVGG